MTLRTLRFLAVAVLGALSLSSCSGGGAARPPCPTGEHCLLIGNGSEPNTLDPHRATGTWEDHILSDMFVGLTQDDADGHPIPGMASSWETSADGLTWTFHLRDARWSDGVPVTADDFVYSLRRILTPNVASEYAYLLYFIKNAQPVNAGRMPVSELGVRAIDPHTLEIRLEHPAPYLLEIAKHQTMMPVPRHIVERFGDGWTDPAHPERYVSNGAYRLVDWRLGNRVRVRRNPYFWDRGSLCFDQIDYFPTTDAVSAERRVLSGELDVNGAISSTRIQRLRQQHPAYVRVATYLGTSYMVFNNRVPAFRDPRVRLAISMGIDRDFIVGHLLRDGRPPAYTFVPPGIANYSPPPPPAWSTWTFARRQAEARRLMAAAGYTPEHPLALEIYHAPDPDSDLYMEALQADLGEIGVRLSLRLRDTQLNYQAMRARDFQLGTAGWIADFNDATNFLTLQQSQTGDQNYGDYNNPAFDRLLALADHEPDAQIRAGYLRQAEAIMLRDAPIVPISFSVNKNLVNPRITGWRDNIVDHHRSRWLCEPGAHPTAAPTDRPFAPPAAATAAAR